MSNLNKSNDTGNSEELSLGDQLYKFLPYWPGLLLLIILSLGAAWFYLRYTIPIYQTSATILIKDDKKVGTLDPLEAFDLFGGKKSVENEIEILKSKTLMQEVVKNLHLYSPVSAKGRVISSNAYLVSPLIIEIKDFDSIRYEKNIPFKFNPNTRTVLLEGKNYPINEFVKTPFGVIRFLLNKNYNAYLKNGNKDDNFSFSLNNINSTANSLLNILTVSPSSKQSTVIMLSIKTEVPKLGEDIINELLKEYNKAAILDKNVLAANTLKFVENRLEFVVKDLDSVEGSLQNFKAQNKIIDISAQGEIYLKTVAENDQKISEINMQLAMLDEVQSYVVGKGKISGVVPGISGVADPGLTILLQNLSDLELKYEQTKNIVPENHPSIVSLVDAINKLKPGILENIKSQKNSLLAAKANINITNDRFSNMLKNIPEKERELLGISRQQSIKNNIYTFLLQKREETALSFASAIADSRIIDKAQSSDAPVSPKRNLIYIATFFIALLMGLAIIHVKEILVRTVQSKSDIEKYTKLPFLGEVMYDKSKSSIVIEDGRRSFIAEQFRQLRTSLGYLGIDEAHKRILITSSISGEGKSFIAINLGISLALVGKKVVLLELDLRKPKISEKFNISRNQGISNYLIGKLEMSEIIKPTKVENLFFIPSGPIPPNPSELISGERLKSLLDHLDTEFDFVLIDTAPANPVTDAFILSPLSDVTLFVVRHDYTPKVFIQKLGDQYAKGELKNPAIVYNGIKGKGIKKYGSYGEGYGYTEEMSDEKWWKNLFAKR